MRRKRDDLFEIFPDLPRYARPPIAERLARLREKAGQARERAMANARRQRAAAQAFRDRIDRLRQAPGYSVRTASSGSTRAARRAGK